MTALPDPLPKAAVFDIGNVLVEWDPMRVYRDLVPDEAERAALFARVDFDGMNVAGDRNGSLEAEVAALAARHPEDAPLIHAWRERWAELFGPAIPRTAALLREARAAGIPVVALSNFAADTYLLGRDMHPVLQEFDVEVISGREGCIKPEPRIYEIVEARTGLSGPDLWFLDDRADNVAAARARGWRAELFVA